jgi:hypothetical protein
MLGRSRKLQQKRNIFWYEFAEKKVTASRRTSSGRHKQE